MEISGQKLKKLCPCCHKENDSETILEFCSKCKSAMEAGIILVSINDKGKRTGGFVVLLENTFVDFFKEFDPKFTESAINSRWALIPEEIFKLMKLDGLEKPY